ncbi:MAG: hypothetical protein C0475_00780 [Planctomyces sp.]|nr:hypothetical protein [Planctomyces sp.]
MSPASGERAAGASGWQAGARAGASAPAWALLGAVVLLGLVSDLASKWLAFGKVAGSPVAVLRSDVLAAQRAGVPIQALVPTHAPVRVVPGLLDLTLVLNPGAVFGVGAGRRVLFVAFTALAVSGALALFARGTGPRDRWTHVGLGLVVAGGLGNLYDRVVYACVRDFIHPLPKVRFPWGLDPLSNGGEVWPYVSNVADLHLLVGVGILVVVLGRSGGGRALAGTPEGAGAGAAEAAASGPGA